MSRVHVQRRSQGIAVLALVALVMTLELGCSAKQPAAEAPPEVVAPEVLEPGADPAVDSDTASTADAEPKETCHGALDCTFFGLGAVLAAPFWVLGAFLGLAF